MGRKDKAISQESTEVIPIGTRLRYVRQSKKVSLTEMAAKLNYTKGYLSGVENGKMKPSESLVRNYEAALDLEPDELKELVQLLQTAGLPDKQLIWYMSHRRNLFFTGREIFLESISERLTGSRAMPWILAITGLAGIGKSQLVVEYVYRHRDKYRAVLWLSADSEGDLVRSFVELANHLGLSERNAQDREATVSFVHEWIRENRQCLVILDNVENLHDIYDYLLPLGESQIILTTRTQVIGADAQTLEVVEMSIEEGALFLLRRAKILPLNASLSDTSELIRIQAQDIAEAMGGLPLALEQAGSYIEETGCSLSGYLHLIKRQKTGMQSEPGPVSANYYRSVASTWMLSFEMTRQANPVAAELLYLCAFLKPDKIYEDLLLAGVPALGPTFQTIASNPLELHRAIGELRKYSLVRTDPGSSTLSIHRLVQEVIQNTLEFGEQRQWVKLTVKVVNMAFPLLTTAEWHEAWPICQRYSSQAEACAALIDQWELEGEEVSQLLSKLGKYLEERTQFAEAERVYHQAIKIDRQYYGEEHIRVADDFVNLAISSTRQAKYERALEFYKRAIFIQDKVLGSEHLDSKMLKNYIDLLRKVDQEGEATKWDKRMKRKPVKQLQKVLRRRAVNDDDKDIIYDKENYWTYQKRLGDFNSDIHISDIPGASFQYNFVGVGIEILSDTSSVHGEVDIYLDDVYLQTINTSRISDRLTQTIIFEKTNLESGTHTLKVVLVKGVFILDALAVFFYDSEDAEA